MITSQQVIARLKELSEDKKLLKEYNSNYRTDIKYIEFIEGGTTTMINLTTSQFTFYIEVYDYKGVCYYSVELSETAWKYDFDDLTDEENIKCMFTNDGEFSESDNVDDIDFLMTSMIPSKEETSELASRIKSLIKFKDKMKDIVDEYDGNQYFVVDFAKSLCDCF